MRNTVGQVQLQDANHPANNGTFPFAGTADNVFTISNFTCTAENPSDVQIAFPLHNQQSVDIYSLGPNGLTRAFNQPIPGGQLAEWKPWSGATEFDKWVQVWGTSGDGNDVMKGNSNIVAEEKDRDDINNW
jgi:hypothetical protein